MELVISIVYYMLVFKKKRLPCDHSSYKRARHGKGKNRTKVEEKVTLEK